ncbi:MAG: hypothetical protein AABZ23_00325 [Deltaproteobacteria bacterium]
MAIKIIRIFLSIGVFTLAGVAVMRLINRKGLLKCGIAFEAALGFLLGMGVISLQMFFYSLASVRFGFLNISIPWLLLFVLSFFVRERQNAACQLNLMGEGIFKGKGLISFVLFAIISLQVVYAFVYAAIMPVSAWDSWAIWFFKAKAFYVERAVSPGFLMNSEYSYDHPEYPNLAPLSLAFVYLTAGGVEDALAKLLYPAKQLAMLVVFYCALKRVFSARPALVFTAVLSLTPIIVIHASGVGSGLGGLYAGDFTGYADLMLSVCFLCAGVFIYLSASAYEAGAQEAGVHAMLAAFFLAMGAWTKNEGLIFAFAGAVILIVSAASSRGDWPGRAFAIIAALAAFILPWALFKGALGLKTEFAGRASIDVLAGNAERLAPIVKNMLFYMFGKVSLYNFIWWAYALSGILNLRAGLRMPLLGLNALILLQLSLYAFAYMITPSDVNWHLATSLDRVLMQVSPLAMLVASLNLGAVLRLGKKAGQGQGILS